MIKLSQEQVFERYDALSDRLREVMSSDNTTNMLWAIGEAHYLGEERIRKIAGVVGYIFLGFIHLEDSAKEIARETNIDRRLADELAREIQVKILAPVIPEIQKLYHYGSDAAADSTPPPPSTPVPMRPSFARPSASESATTPPTPPVNPDTPFILHEEQKEIEQTRPRDETLVRPSFYEGADIRHQTLDTGTERAAARLEIGGVEGDQIKGPRVGRTEEPQIRVVHYTGPQTPVDPFGPSVSPEQEKPAEPAKPSQDVHPENIVDLKDLPK